MTDQTPNPELNNTPVGDQEPFVPPVYMLGLAAVGLIVALFVLLTQPSFNVVGYGGLAFAVLALIAWVLLAPDQAKGVLTGRAVRFGGLSIIVTILLTVTLVIVFTLVRDQSWRVDLTERSDFTLAEQSRQAIGGMGVDPEIAQIKLIAFYDVSQASLRDRDTVLFDDYAETSGGKITYEFVDPDRNPQQASAYGIERAGQIAVVALDAAGEPDIANAEIVNPFNVASQSDYQTQMTNAILRLSASGDFRAYFLSVTDGIPLIDDPSGQGASMSLLNNALVNQFGWTTQEVTPIELMSPESEIDLDDPTIDGSVLVIPGGSRPLSDDEMAFIADYVDDGGDLIIFASPNFQAQSSVSTTDTTPLALGENLSTYLTDNFGMHFVNDVVIDPQLAFQTPIIPVAVDLNADSFITAPFAGGQLGMVFEIPHSIQISDVLPTNVSVSELARSGPQSYAKTDLDAVLNGEFEQGEGDAQGPFVLAASAENAETGARIVLFGSPSIPVDAYAPQTGGSGIVNIDVAAASMVWTTNFDQFISEVTVLQQALPQDTPMFADQSTLWIINLLTIFVLPIGVLLVGVWVWWRGREREPNR
ncbi:MAG: Gldg family protein [Burkholderiales bacterium]|nr:Gldg family protein [Anaerolineae bacterium]